MESTAPKAPAYAGLLGLDRLPAIVKLVNCGVTVGLGIILAVDSWAPHLGRDIYFRWHPLNWPLVLLFSWPLCTAVIWLRLTGLRWRWAFLAAAMICVAYAGLASVMRFLRVFLA